MTFVIPINYRVLLFQRFQVASGFVTRRIYGVALVDGPDRYPVVVLGSDLLGEPMGLAKGSSRTAIAASSQVLGIADLVAWGLGD